MTAAFAVHCCQFYRPQTSAINCLAFDKTSKRIALSRANSCIEIWTMKTMPPCRERSFPFIDNASVEALSWCRGRLFATGLDGFLREWSLNSLWPVNQIKLTPSAAWCMASNRTETHLVVGTEEGGLYLVSVTADSVYIEKRLTRSGDRIMSVAWSYDGRTIVTGSIGVIRVWDLLSGSCLSRMTVGDNQSDSRNLVWSIAITRDPIIVTGDSRGITSFWDCQTSTLINAYQSHKADVLSVCYSETRNLVFSSGIDPSICQYHPVEEEITNQRQVLGDPSSSVWVSSNDSRLQYVEHVRLNLHTHDVRCLIAADEWLVSGGVDGILTFSKYPPNTVLNYYPFNPDNISVAARGRRVLFQYPEYVELWTLGSTDAEISEKDGQILPLAKEPEKLAQIKCLPGSLILCSTIDSWGRVIAYSDGKRTCVYQVKMQDKDENGEDTEAVVIQPVKCLNEPTLIGSSALHFSTSSMLFLADERGFVHRLDIDDVIGHLETILQPQNGTLIKKLTSPNNKKKKSLIAALTSDNRIFVIDHEKTCVIAQVPYVESLIVDFKFSSSDEALMILHSDGRLLLFDYGSKKNSKADEWRQLRFDNGPLGFTNSLVKNSGNLIAYDDDKLTLYSAQNGPDALEKSSSISSRFRHICKAEFLKDDDLVIVKIDHERYLADLPPSLKVKKFGVG